MNVRKKFVLSGIFLLIFVICSMISFFMPKIEIEINGKLNIDLSIGEIYKDLGANAYFVTLFSKKEIPIKITGEIDIATPGKYIFTYKAQYKWLKEEKIKIINVVDSIKPEITVNEEVTFCKKNNLLELNATAIDNYDGDISDKIKYKLFDNYVKLQVSDSSGNLSEMKAILKNIDNEYPIITLKGDETVYLIKNTNYEELGYKGYDSCEGDITNKVIIEDNIDIKTPGNYEIVYKLHDAMGNETKKIRKVIVINEDDYYQTMYPIANKATIYLTFDDGPGIYTESILDVLDNYNIKATFFVTNQFPKYQNLIKKEHEKGHTIGVHTYSHKWNIYNSVEKYLEDFNNINNIIYEQTGSYSNIFRFPGGSSNTVSQNYKKGIMTELIEYMNNKGYKYYDWNVDSGDTSKSKNSAKDIIQNVKASLKGDGDYIILMHDIKKNTVDALPEIIEYAKALGYEFKAIDENTPLVQLKVVN